MKDALIFAAATALILTFAIIVCEATHEANPTPTIPEQRSMQADKWLAAFNTCLDSLPQGPRKAEAIACTALADDQVLGARL